MHVRRFGKGSIAIAAGAAVVLAVAGVAVASIPNADNVISGCYSNGSGTLRVIDTSSSQCTSKETAISWNQQGVPGEPREHLAPRAHRDRQARRGTPAWAM